MNRNLFPLLRNHCYLTLFVIAKYLQTLNMLIHMGCPINRSLTTAKLIVLGARRFESLKIIMNLQI